MSGALVVMENYDRSARSEMVGIDQRQCCNICVHTYLLALWSWKTMISIHVQKWLTQTRSQQQLCATICVGPDGD